MRRILLHFAATVVAVAVGLLLYDRLVVGPARLIGVVDVGEVYRLKEAEFTQIVTKSASEDDRQRAIAMARAFAQRLPSALEELPRDCACLVVVRSAVAGIPPNATDLTALLKHKVDLP